MYRILAIQPAKIGKKGGSRPSWQKVSKIPFNKVSCDAMVCVCYSSYTVDINWRIETQADLGINMRTNETQFKK
jgi:hypothetical protein